MKTIALIGKGKQGQRLLKYLPKYFDVKYVVGKDYDLSKLYQDKSIATLAIATPPETHFNIIRSCLIYNKSVFVEKPITLNINEALSLEWQSTRNNLKIFTDYSRIYSDNVNWIYNNIDQIGKIKEIRVYTSRLLELPLKYNIHWLLSSHWLAVIYKLISLKDVNFIFDERVIWGTDNIDLDIWIRCSTDKDKSSDIMTIFGSKGCIVYTPSKEITLKMFIDSRLIDACSFPEDDTLDNVIKEFSEGKENLKMSINITKIIQKGIK
jgi:hypothetical protein